MIKEARGEGYFQIIFSELEGVEWHEESNTFYMEDTTFLQHVTVSLVNSPSLV